MRHPKNGHILVSGGILLTVGIAYLTLSLYAMSRHSSEKDADQCQCQCQIHLSPPDGGASIIPTATRIIHPPHPTSTLNRSKEIQSSTASSMSNPLTLAEMLSGAFSIKQDDLRLLAHIRNFVIRPPPQDRSGGVKLSDRNPHKKPEQQQQIYRVVIDILKNMTNGFYVECGANDGELYSNTLALELIHNWNGLLIEPDPKPFQRLINRNRNAWIAPVCLSTQPFPAKTQLLRSENNDLLTIMSKLTLSKSQKKGARPWTGERFTVDCYPLFSLLLSINVTTVDYFSLDVEGAELPILQTIPWSRLLIRVLSIEVPLGTSVNGDIHRYMSSIGYRLVHYVQNAYSHDNVYIHPSVNLEI